MIIRTASGLRATKPVGRRRHPSCGARPRKVADQPDILLAAGCRNHHRSTRLVRRQLFRRAGASRAVWSVWAAVGQRPERAAVQRRHCPRYRRVSRRPWTPYRQGAPSNRPRLLAPTDIAEAMGKALGRKVRYQDVPMGMFLKAAASMGISEFVITQLHWFLRDYQQNAFGIGAPTNVEELTGRAPEDFETIARRYVAASPFAIRGPAGVMREVAGLAAALLTRTPNINKMETASASPHLQLRPCRRLARLANNARLAIMRTTPQRPGARLACCTLTSRCYAPTLHTAADSVEQPNGICAFEDLRKLGLPNAHIPCCCISRCGVPSSEARVSIYGMIS